MEDLKRYDFLTQEECDTIVREILSLEDTVKRLGPDIYDGTSDDSLTGRYKYFNYLNVPKINTILEPKLKKLLGPCVLQCWANILRPGEGIDKHRHFGGADDAYTERHGTSGNIFLYGDPTIGTYYNFPKLSPLSVKYDNKVGELSLFTPTLFHGVYKNTTDDMRISMAIDVDRNLTEDSINFLMTCPYLTYYCIR
tara:strand:+ start:40 stop:627 length:588 start_codon:yes stop_codon:yes gene_type:complete